MLKRIIIEDFLFIRRAELELSGAFNVITGETGAGKSILLGAINVSLGAVVAAESIHPQAKHFRVSLTFDLRHDMALFKRVMKNHDGKEGEEAPGILTLLTVQERSGTRFDFINNTPARLDQLAALREMLIDIHSQRQNQYLLKKSAHFHFFDAFLEQSETRHRYRLSYEKWQAKKKQVAELQQRYQQELTAKAFLEFTKNELEEYLSGEQAASTQGIAVLREELAKLEKQEKQSDALYQLKQAAESGFSALEQAEAAFMKARELGVPSIHAARYNKAGQAFAEDFLALREAIRDVSHTMERADVHGRIDALQKQMAGLEGLEKKYGVKIEELQLKYDGVCEKLDFLTTAAEEEKVLVQEMATMEEKAFVIACELHDKRRTGVAVFEKRLQKELNSLGMENGRIFVALNPERRENLSPKQLKRKLQPYGFDKVEFLYSSSKDMGAKPFKDIASGGEMSRMMLALKVLLSRKISVGTMVFDEIDVGVGGLTAGRLAAKLRFLSQYKQILVITHLPQIARRADMHFRIEKNVEKNDVAQGSLRSHLTRLEPRDIISEICRMLGRQPTPENLEFAERFIREDD